MFRSQEQEQFSKIISAHMRTPDAPLLLEGSTGLGKTTAFLAAAFESDLKIAICLPTNALVDQMKASSDMMRMKEAFPNRSVASFRSRRFFEDALGEVDEAAFDKQKDKALAADIMLCTSSSVILDQRLRGAYNGSVDRDVLIFDEADQVPGLAALASDMEIDAKTIKRFKSAGKTVKEVTANLLQNQKVDVETRAKAKLIAEAAYEPEMWFRRVGMTEGGGIALKHRLPGRLLKKISNRASTIFISATLSTGGTFNDFRRSMGIGETSRDSDMIEPAHHGYLSFHFFADDPVDTDEWMDVVIDQIEASERPVLVATGSHSLAQEIGSRLEGAIIRSRDETMTSAVARMEGEGIVIGAGAWAGMDTPVQWKTVLVPRVPFIGPAEIYDEWDERAPFNIGDPITSYMDNRNAAARRMKQVFGRGIRHPDASCAIVICDPRIDQLGEIVPTRFRSGWKEGALSSVTQTKIERNPRLRAEALRHHGVNCQACGHEPYILREIEVHHKRPLALAQKEIVTQLEDVEVLCRICHARAHENGNDVKTLDELKEIAQKKTKKTWKVSF